MRPRVRSIAGEAEIPKPPGIAQFAMTEPIRGVPAVDLPGEWPGVGPFTVVAAQQDLGADFQAILRREHDVLNLSIVFASPIGAERSLRLGSSRASRAPSRGRGP